MQFVDLDFLVEKYNNLAKFTNIIGFCKDLGVAIVLSLIY